MRHAHDSQRLLLQVPELRLYLRLQLVHEDTLFDTEGARGGGAFLFLSGLPSFFRVFVNKLATQLTAPKSSISYS
jgi:hypothetical protein